MNEPNETVRELNRKAIAERLKLAIGETRMTLDSFATAAGVSVSGLKKWLAGVSDPAFGSIVDAARVANVRLDWLASGKGPMRDGDGEQVRGSEKQSESYDYEVVHSVAWVIAEEEGKDPRTFADKFAGMCEYLQQTQANPEKEDMKKVVKIFDFAMKRRGQ